VFRCLGDGGHSYLLAIVEFDDQGLCYARAQMQGMVHAVRSLKQRDPVIVVFVHGWKHDARGDDDNLTQFRTLLARLAGQTDRPVLGVFGAWRGMTWYDQLGVTENVTFWGRKAAAQRVAQGSVREMLGHLRRFRDEQQQRPVLVIVGHSFGGLLVYAAVAQSLIETASDHSHRPAPDFANLILLVNPAFEAIRYLPVHEQVVLRTQANEFSAVQKPLFISVTAKNDWATGLAFPAGMAIPSLGESVCTRQERSSLLFTMGHLRWMKTHDLGAPAAAPRARKQVQGAHHPGHHGAAQLIPAAWTAPGNPFWVVQATRQVVDGHDGIWGQIFVDWVFAQVALHLTSVSSAAGTA
jgi:pimeloyl-ACP methyl ester carboxylesterase